ncbi:MAG: hypothetical protein O2887_06800 [Bacteroidetes bacterium]|nr:hypothetical protein [Bacteroidota bacterium]MDA1120188.1 hypothetical protein [Bacteroidota bacterium]
MAFKNPDNNKLVYILLNIGIDTKIVSTEASNLGSYQLLSTEEGDYFQDNGLVVAGRPIALPPMSIHTLIEQ